jgi:ATP-dependent Clp protease ATP-binding subunit ClpA
MRLLSRRRAASLAGIVKCDALPRAKTIRPAEPYLIAGAEEARRLGHSYVGTEHILLVLLRRPAGPATLVLEHLGVSAAEAETAIGACLVGGTPKIDPEALATIGIDFDAVRRRLEQTFGPGALERSQASCLGVAPRAKLALAYALDHAGGEPLRDEHILLGMLSVPDSLAARALGELGVSLELAEVVVERVTGASAERLPEGEGGPSLGD